MLTRRALLSGAAPAILLAAPRRPNVVLVISDDQGYGDLSVHGNPHLKTPRIDSLARDGVQFTQFHVSPVCSPTRSSLMTGRYNYRTGVVDTYLGRSMMYPDEVTLAEVLASAGYRTGIFGKWHLGDNYPLRSIDQGFEQSLVCTGGGLAQPAGPPGNGYFDPVLQANGKSERRSGYCTDIFTSAAIDFIDRNRKRPFFAYVAPNAPHTPLQVEERYVAPFLKSGLDDVTAKVYGMVANLDENMGRLLGAIRKFELDRDTIVIFLTDNGPQQNRYNSGMRGLKGTVYEGGIRVPCFLRYPAQFAGGDKIDRVAAHIDIMPTLLDLCGIPLPRGLRIDGRSLAPLLRGSAGSWQDRALYFQWHRGDEPEPFRACAARSQRYKLVDGKELYDLVDDPSEGRDIAASHPNVVRNMRQGYEHWFRDVSATRGYAPPRIHLGTRHENPVVLTRQDWRGPRAGWSADSLGHWEVDVVGSGKYRVTLRMPPVAAGEASIALNDVSLSKPLAAGASEIVFEPVVVPKGAGRLQASLTQNGKEIGPHYVEVNKL